MLVGRGGRPDDVEGVAAEHEVEPVLNADVHDLGRRDEGVVVEIAVCPHLGLEVPVGRKYEIGRVKSGTRATSTRPCFRTWGPPQAGPP